MRLRRTPRQTGPVNTVDTSEIVTRLRAAGCVFAEDEARLLTEATRSADELDQLVAQRVSGVPLEHLLGWVEFRGIRVGVRTGVFVPRQRTAFLVDEAVALAHAESRDDLVVVDLCCGSGALGLALVSELADETSRIELNAADIDPVAVACARENLAAVGGRAYEGDLFAALPSQLRGRIDILLCNTPYVPSSEMEWMPPEARDHEPANALDGGDDGLDIFRRVAAEAPEWLAPGGHLLVEISEEQRPTATAIATGAGLIPRIAHSPDLYATVIICTR
ncbi:putative protein N(5)-glutamine methyltransferase [Nocardia cyriacigeorgica]|uniref:peptide chain release factor N(5)-glutamine methyltransferase n=1 Tax=Nocardia cyriacigeorgica TaxID=135487 RepID=A0A6P1D6V3_9NOCA|nr:putative protein N(5)-glutamine methyltransferase [Nocardia cyriacigeorgica]NEW39943.1 putative protein N(5)-glutamine methyltransferase [Nocardia cyriacigeorgica]NEW45241.1 putative protein N(5)-glutamine methyltransferase [Nocardia cyriacigeorgica]NEW51426.1 putative protein N(5)-glutamine methyltransferase [Nocardia cyriacigeorgica]NEW55338.1 putative protein N(5)-glutamine methyltransferase [Nocardia cyriacigeorgica]